MAEIISPSRRGFLLGAGALLAAPAIVRASSLMPIKAAPRVFWAMDFGKDCGTVIWVRMDTDLIVDRYVFFPKPVWDVDLRENPLALS